ncbi:MAG: TVP38/TMEM64 family protein, partial [Phormidesmis sp.]
MILSRKFCGFFIAAASLAIALHAIGWQSLMALFDRQVLIQFFSNTERSPVSGISLFIVAHVIANAVGVPGTLLVIVGGAVYGLWWGTAWSVIGATLGAVVSFWLARYLLYDWFEQRFHSRPVLKRLNHALRLNALWCVLTIRFSPISPFNVVNFAFGLTPVPVKDYALGTLIGIIPGTLAYTWLGVTGSDA